MSEENLRRLRRYLFNPEWFFKMPEGQLFCVKQALPPDAEYVTGGFNNASNDFYMLIRSSAFEPVAAGCTIPYADGPLLEVILP